MHLKNETCSVPSDPKVTVQHSASLFMHLGQVAFTVGRVLLEHVREAQEKTDPKLRDEDVSMLPEEEKLILLALARSLKREKEAIYLPFEEVESIYYIVCEEYGKKPVGRVLLHAFIKNLEATGVIILSENFSA